MVLESMEDTSEMPPEGVLQGHCLVKHLSGFVEHRHCQGNALQILKHIALAASWKT